MTTLAAAIFVAHAGAGSRIERLCSDTIAQSKRVYTLDLPENDQLVRSGVSAQSVHELTARFLNHHKHTA